MGNQSTAKETRKATATAAEKMHIFFDVDGTLIGYNDQDMRPLMCDMITRLVNRGHKVYLWTRQGKQHAVDVAEANNLAPILSGTYEKPPHDLPVDLHKYGVPVVPDFCVDDDEYCHIPTFGGQPVDHYISVQYQGKVDTAARTVYRSILRHERIRSRKNRHQHRG